jgi:hypothetical protein
MYPEPYITREEWNGLRLEISTNGVEEDTILQDSPERSVFGMNLAFGWPLPSILKEPYERVASALSSLDSGLYVYPYRQTHVTVMTLMNFKYHPDPSDEEVREFLQLVPVIVSRITPFLSSVKPFIIDVGPPVFSQRAGFLPILNETGEISALRSVAASVIHPIGLRECNIPNAIHSTIVRFLRQLTDPEGFLSGFESLAANSRLGQATVDEFLLTSETKPYMRTGEILHRFRLGG